MNFHFFFEFLFFEFFSSPRMQRIGVLFALSASPSRPKQHRLPPRYANRVRRFHLLHRPGEGKYSYSINKSIIEF